MLPTRSELEKHVDCRSAWSLRFFPIQNHFTVHFARAFTIVRPIQCSNVSFYRFIEQCAPLKWNGWIFSHPVYWAMRFNMFLCARFFFCWKNEEKNNKIELSTGFQYNLFFSCSSEKSHNSALVQWMVVSLFRLLLFIQVLNIFNMISIRFQSHWWSNWSFSSESFTSIFWRNHNNNFNFK